MKLVLQVIAAVGLAAATAGPVAAASLRDGQVAHKRQDYVKAAHLLRRLAERGDPQAQTRLGFMYEYGHGVPQSYVEAASWYCRAAEQNHAYAQYLLGLLYDKGHGVRRDFVEAHKWLNVAASHAPSRDREDWIRVRQAVGSKMSFGEIALAQQLATAWRPKREFVVIIEAK